MKRWAVLSLLLVFACCVSRAALAAQDVEQWDTLELTFTGPASGNPFVDVKLAAQFTQDGTTITVPGFYDGQGTYRVRFSPPSQGQWKYHTTSNAAELSGKEGAFSAIPPSGNNHGPLRVHKTFHFAYTDGTPYYQIGTTCYAWTHQPQELQEQTLKTLASAPFNKLRMCIFPKSFVYNANEPANYPFIRKPDGSFDFTQFDPANWQNLERRISDLRKLGIEADLILFHPYDRWGFAKMEDATDDFYVRYAIARLSAYRNVWWSLANEYDFMVPALRPNQNGIKQVEDFDRFFSILQNEDPYGRLRGIHHAAVLYDHTKPYVTHASIQNRDLTQVIEWRNKFEKPIVVDECRYEGNISQSWGNISGEAMVRQFWIGTVCGGYVGHGETLKDPQDILWWSKGGVLHGQSPSRIAYLKKIMEGLPYTDMAPSRPDPNLLVLSKPGQVHLLYAMKEGSFAVQLPGEKDYVVELIDTWNMTTQKLDPAKAGEFKFTAPRADYLLRVMAAN